MSDQVGNQIVGFLVTRLILIVSSVSTSNLPLPGLDAEKLFVLRVAMKLIGLNQATQAVKGRGV